MPSCHDRYPHLRKVDPELHSLIQKQTQAESTTLKMIPSENFAQFAVLEATGSTLTNKYAEGYPGGRYYQGNEIIDEIENLAIERAKSLFGAEHANVQPYSGSPANQAAYRALGAAGCKIMGMPLPLGGHLTHGWGVNFSGPITFKSPTGRTRRRACWITIRFAISPVACPRMIWVGPRPIREVPIRQIRPDRPGGGCLSGGRHRPHQWTDRCRSAS